MIASDYNLNTNTVYEVILDARIAAQAAGPSSSAESVYANIDPMFSVSDPEYTITLSDGFGNGIAGSVPELSTWVMVLFGLSGVGFLAYRRRSSQFGTVPAVQALGSY